MRRRSSFCLTLARARVSFYWTSSHARTPWKRIALGARTERRHCVLTGHASYDPRVRNGTSPRGCGRRDAYFLRCAVDASRGRQCVFVKKSRAISCVTQRPGLCVSRKKWWPQMRNAWVSSLAVAVNEYYIYCALPVCRIYKTYQRNRCK